MSSESNMRMDCIKSDDRIHNTDDSNLIYKGVWMGKQISSNKPEGLWHSFGSQWIDWCLIQSRDLEKERSMEAMKEDETRKKEPQEHEYKVVKESAKNSILRKKRNRSLKRL